jgi:hypothetical protein
LQEIWQPDEEGFFDINLAISTAEVESNYLIVVGEGLFHGKNVGLKVGFQLNMRHGIVGAKADQSAFMQDGIRFASTGRESDRLLEAMAELYGLPSQERHFVSNLGMVALLLADHPVDLRLQRSPFKVFINHDSGPERYAELFVNVDLSAKRLELHEKDPEYRRNVVSALSAADSLP